jgi:hypothetical protein
LVQMISMPFSPEVKSRLSRLIKCKRVVFPSGIRAGLSLTMLSWIRQRERDAVFAEVGRWQTSGG